MALANQKSPVCSCFCGGDFPLVSAEAGNAGNITIQGVTGSGSPATNVSLDHNMIITGISGGTSTSTPATITITAHTLALANAVVARRCEGRGASRQHHLERGHADGGQ